MSYQRIVVSTGALIGAPGPLPEHLVGLENETLANLSAALSPATIAQLDLADTGFLYVADPVPPPPPPPRAELPKSVVMSRVFAMGFEPQIQQLFASNFQLQAQWFSPDWPNVFHDDPALMQALGALGMSSDQIAQVTAPL